MEKTSSPLSDYELIDLLNSFSNAAGEHFSYFLTALFAFLLMSYLAGDKLSSRMVRITVFLFTVFSILPVTATLHAALWYMQIGSELARRGTDLTQHISYFPARMMEGSSGYIFAGIIAICGLGAYTAALLFLREVRQTRAKGTPNKSVESDT